MKIKGRTLRKGYTTGASAAAATKAALLQLLLNKKVDCVEVTLPRGGKLVIGIDWTTIANECVTCAVTKDGGDDPDVTHGAQILSTVSLNDDVGTIRMGARRRSSNKAWDRPSNRSSCYKSCAINDDQVSCIRDCWGAD